MNCDKGIEGEVFLYWAYEDVYLCGTCLLNLHDQTFLVKKPREGSKPVYKKIPITNEMRWQIWERDDFSCQYCGTRKFLAIDHIDPERFGGESLKSNLVTSCRTCNSKKGSRTPDEAGMTLKFDPR